MAEPFPMIPGLMGGEDFPGEEDGTTPEAKEGSGDAVADLTAELDVVDDIELDDALVACEEAVATGELDALIAGDTGDVGIEVVDNTDPSDITASSEPLAEDPTAVVTVVGSMLADAQGMRDQLNTLAEATDASESDIDLADALADAEEHIATIEDAHSQALAAEEAQDPDAAAEAKEAATEAFEKLKEVHEEARGDATDAAQELSDDKEIDPLEAWASENA